MFFSSKTINEWAGKINWALRRHCKGSGALLDLSKYVNQTGLVFDGAKYSIGSSVGLALLCEDCPESCYIWDAMISLVNQFGSLKGLYDAIQSVRTTFYTSDASVFSQKLLAGKTPQSHNPFSEDALYVWVGALSGTKISDSGSEAWKNAGAHVPDGLLPKTVNRVNDPITGGARTLQTDNFTILGFLSEQYRAEKNRERIFAVNADEMISYLRSICDAHCFLDKVLNSASNRNSFVRRDGGIDKYAMYNCYEMTAYLFDISLNRVAKVLNACIEDAVLSVVDIRGEMNALVSQLQYAFECLELFNARAEITYFGEVVNPSLTEKKADLESSRKGLIDRAETMTLLLREFSAFTDDISLKKKLVGESNPLTNGIRYGGLAGKLQEAGKNSSDASDDLKDKAEGLLASIRDILKLKKSVLDIGDYLSDPAIKPEDRIINLCDKKAVSAFTEELTGMVDVLESDVMPLFDGKAECYGLYKSDIEKYIDKLKDVVRTANIRAEYLPDETAKDVVEINPSDGGHIVNLGRDGEELRVQFSLLDEDFSELSFTGDEEKSPELYDYSYYHRLVDATVDVRKQPVFGNLKRINAYPFFKPFSYQVDSVHTMLSRFEGRGVFGDQVGLGKTLQALMTAYTMYQHGAIRNVVVIAKRQTIGQWRDNELRVKFRGKDGKCLFDVYPKEKKEFGFDELFEALERDDKHRTGKRPKLYTISVESFKNALSKIKEAIDASDYYNAAFAFNKTFSNGLRERITKIFAQDGKLILKEPVVESVISDVYSLFGFSSDYESELTKLSNKIEELEDVDTLQMLRLAVLLPAQKMSGDELYYNGTHNFIDGMGALYAESDKPDLSKLSSESQKVVVKLNNILVSIDKKIAKIEAKIAADESKDLFRKKRVIDLLVFDEVQELLVAANEKTDGVDDNVLRQEFIARIPKKYCVLLSATPIRSDLSDIFNLMYMVDKNRLGVTRKEAEERFYNAYCGGHDSLSDMANAPNPEKQFAKLNGLINTMFTRKRLYDADVIESISRHTATAEEIQAARAVGRIDENRTPIDYGGQRFYDLMRCLSVVKNRGDGLSESEKDSLRTQLTAIFDEKDYDDINVVLLSLKDIVESIETASLLWRKRRAMEERKQLSEVGNIDVIDDFIVSRDALLEKEKEDRLSAAVHDLRIKCDLDISYINRGMLDFYSTYHSYSTTFLADFLDWRRPYKHGVALPFKSHEEKIRVLGDLLVPDAGDDEEFEAKYGNLGISHDELVDIQKSKIVIFDKWTRVRRELYRRVRAEKIDYGEPRKVYIDGITSKDKAADSKDKAKGGKKKTNLEDAINEEAQENGFTADELVDLEYYPGTAKYNAIQNKPASSRTAAEKYILSTFKSGGKVVKDESEEVDDQASKDQRDRNFNRFKTFSADDDGNWNALYFFEYTKVAGTDLKAASALIIGQLDERDQNYMEPLRFEQLIGRISRTGQTERCLVLICLLKGFSDEGEAVSEETFKFNKKYYELLSDPDGFDLLGACQAEVDFVVPVVMACARRLFSEEWSYHQDEVDEITGDEISKASELLKAQSRYNDDQSRFRAVYKSRKIPYIAPVTTRNGKNKATGDKKKQVAVETIPDVLAYALKYDDDISVVCKGTHEYPNTPTVLKPSEALKEMVRYYAKTLCHNADDVEE